MLVLTRLQGEGIDIGNNVKIVILNVDRNKVTVGIEAPKQVKILRCELEKRS
jgi:carbon storage regulator